MRIVFILLGLLLGAAFFAAMMLLPQASLDGFLASTGLSGLAFAAPPISETGRLLIGGPGFAILAALGFLLAPRRRTEDELDVTRERPDMRRILPQVPTPVPAPAATAGSTAMPAAASADPAILGSFAPAAAAAANEAAAAPVDLPHAHAPPADDTPLGADEGAADRFEPEPAAAADAPLLLDQPILAPAADEVEQITVAADGGIGGPPLAADPIQSPAIRRGEPIAPDEAEPLAAADPEPLAVSPEPLAAADPEPALAADPAPAPIVDGSSAEPLILTDSDRADIAPAEPLSPIAVAASAPIDVALPHEQYNPYSGPDMSNGIPVQPRTERDEVTDVNESRPPVADLPAAGPDALAGLERRVDALDARIGSQLGQIAQQLAEIAATTRALSRTPIAPAAPAIYVGPGAFTNRDSRLRLAAAARQLKASLAPLPALD